MGTKFDVQYTTKMPKDDMGETIGNERQIKIRAKLTGEKLKATLLHEVIHAILHVSGMTEILTKYDEDGKLEEGLVVALEHGLTPIVDLTDGN